MTELTVPDPKAIIDECNEICQSLFFSNGKRSFTQLERIFVNADRFVLLLYSLDWPSIQSKHPQAAGLRDSILTNANWIREESLKAYRDKSLKSELKEMLWERYVQTADALITLCGATDARLATRLENAIECPTT